MKFDMPVCGGVERTDGSNVATVSVNIRWYDSVPCADFLGVEIRPEMDNSYIKLLHNN